MQLKALEEKLSEEQSRRHKAEERARTYKDHVDKLKVSSTCIFCRFTYMFSIFDACALRIHVLCIRYAELYTLLTVYICTLLAYTR